MELAITMIFALNIAFFSAHSFTSIFEQEYKITFRQSIILFLGLLVLLFFVSYFGTFITNKILVIRKQ